MKVKITLNVVLDEDKEKELTFELESYSDIVNVYWGGKLLGKITEEEFREFVGSLTGLFEKR